MADKYNIVRFYENGRTRRRVLEYGVTLEEAQAHCSDPNTSWRTAEKWSARQRTRTIGAWFDGYERA